MPKKPNEIGQRLRQWSATQFPSLAAFARALGWIPQNLTPYLNGTILPGNALQAKLRELGCDIEWLMTGKDKEECDRAKTRELSPNDVALLQVLKEEGIESAEMLRAFFDKEEIAKDIASIMAERYKRRIQGKMKKKRRKR